jgi:hypothetical protein
MLMAENNYQEAQKQDLDVFTMLQQKKHSLNPEVLRLHGNIALCLQKNGQTELAKRMAKRVVEESQRMFGPEHQITKKYEKEKAEIDAGK